MNSEKNSKSREGKRIPFYNFCYDFVKVTGAIPVMLWLRQKIYRPYGTKTPRGAVLVSANHRKLIDPVVVHTVFPARRMHCLATKELYNTRLKAAFFKRMHCIQVDKENFALSSFHDVVSNLEKGRMVVIFPEGGLNHNEDGSLMAFKSGAVLMAHKAGAPILPVYIVEREKWYHRQRIVVGEPFDVRERLGKMPTMQALTEASEELRKKEIELREYFESLPIYKKLHKSNENKVTEKEEVKV